MASSTSGYSKRNKTDIQVLGCLSQLQELNLAASCVNDVSLVLNLSKLKTLYVTRTAIEFQNLSILMSKILC
jgi:hypothetical protein